MDDQPTELTREDIDNFVKKMFNGDFDIKNRPCWKCSKEFIPNYHDAECDECFFKRYPKEEVMEYFRSFF